LGFAFAGFKGFGVRVYEFDEFVEDSLKIALAMN